MTKSFLPYYHWNHQPRSVPSAWHMCTTQVKIQLKSIMYNTSRGNHFRPFCYFCFYNPNLPHRVSTETRWPAKWCDISQWICKSNNIEFILWRSLVISHLIVGVNALMAPQNNKMPIFGASSFRDTISSRNDNQSSVGAPSVGIGLPTKIIYSPCLQLGWHLLHLFLHFVRKSLNFRCVSWGHTDHHRMIRPPIFPHCIWHVPQSGTVGHLFSSAFPLERWQLFT